MTDWILRLSEEIAQQWDDIEWTAIRPFIGKDTDERAVRETRARMVGERIERAEAERDAEMFRKLGMSPCPFCGLLLSATDAHCCQQESLTCHLCGHPENGPEHHCPREGA